VQIFEIIARNWKPEIGDPTVIGWLTVLAYLAAGGLLLYKRRLAISLYPSEWARHRLILLVLALAMFALAVNKQLDLQTFATNVGRDLAEAQGWYEKRRVLQVIVLGVIAVLGLAIAFAIVRMRGVMRAHRLVLFGLLLVIGFVAMRASSFFKIDHLLGFQVGGVKMNWVFELGAIAVVIWSAVTSLLQLRKVKRLMRLQASQSS